MLSHAVLLTLEVFVIVGAQPIRSPVVESARLEYPPHDGILIPRDGASPIGNINVHVHSGNVNVYQNVHGSGGEVSPSQDSSTREVLSLADTNTQLSEDTICPPGTSCTELNITSEVEHVGLITDFNSGTSILAPTLNRIPSTVTETEVLKSTETTPCADCPGAATATGSDSAAGVSENALCNKAHKSLNPAQRSSSSRQSLNRSKSVLCKSLP